MLLTTTPTVQGRPGAQYPGVGTGAGMVWAKELKERVAGMSF